MGTTMRACVHTSAINFGTILVVQVGLMAKTTVRLRLQKKNLKCIILNDCELEGTSDQAG